MLELPSLYLITDRTLTNGRPLEDIVHDACEGGVRMVQLREKDLPNRELYDLARTLRTITNQFGTKLLINGRIDIALAAEADGVHLPVNGVPIAVARKALNKGIIGASTHSLTQAEKAQDDGADFITFGPIFSTPSKEKYGPALGLTVLKEITSKIKIPVFAIGGITPERAAECRAHGAHGVAVISAVMGAREVAVAVENFTSSPKAKERGFPTKTSRPADGGQVGNDTIKFFKSEIGNRHSAMLSRLHILTDTVIQSRYSHVDLAKIAIAGGANVIQYREKSASTREMIETAIAIQKLCAAAGVTFIVNDRPDVALLSNADGVHLGQDDLPLAAARTILGPTKIIGISTGNINEAREAQEGGADYIAFGNIFPTGSKIKINAPRGLDQLREFCKAVKLPVIAIGGITRKNAQEVMACGAHGVAVIGDVCRDENPRGAVEELQRLLNPS